MTINRIIELLCIERECMNRGAHDDCDRNCNDCDLVQDDGELNEMYTDVIYFMNKELGTKPIEKTENHFYCKSCSKRLPTKHRPKYCPSCGTKVNWNDK